MPNYYPGAPRAIEPVQSGRLPFFPWGYKRTEQDQSAWESMNQLGKQLIDKGMLGELDHKVFDLKIDPDMQRIADENSKAMTKIQREIIEHEYRKAAVAAYEDRRSMRCQNEATWMGKPLKDVVISGWEHKNQGYELTIQGEMDDYGKCNMFYVQVRKNDLVMRVVIKINPWGVQCDTTFNESTLDEIVIAADMARRNIDREMARRTPDSIYMNLGPYGERDGEYAAREPRGIYSEPKKPFFDTSPKASKLLVRLREAFNKFVGYSNPAWSMKLRHTQNINTKTALQMWYDDNIKKADSYHNDYMPWGTVLGKYWKDLKYHDMVGLHGIRAKNRFWGI